MTTERTAITKHGVTLRMATPTVDIARIEAFEAQLGHRLPEDYRAFLATYNGGKPKPSGFRLANKSGPYTDSLVHWFFSLYDGRGLNLETNRKILRGRMPVELLPIADDPGGNVICLGISGDARGKVYFWDHEHERNDGPDWSNIDLVADSFDAFMAGLFDTDR